MVKASRGELAKFMGYNGLDIRPVAEEIRALMGAK